MKLSADTVNVLKYFSTISSGIVISPGNVISTMTPQKNIIASATVTEDFPQEFGIYNLSEFLNILSVFGQPDLIFKGGKQSTIKENKTSVNYTFAEPALMTKAPKSLKMDPSSVVAEFELKAEVLGNLQKAMNILNLQDVIIDGIDNSLYLRGSDLKQSSSSSYDVEIGETDAVFRAIIKTDFLKLMPGTYNVAVANKYLRFTHTERQLTTWIGVDEKSKF